MPDLQMRRNLSRRQLEESQLSGRRLNRETSRRLTGRLVPFVLIPFATLCLLGGVLANPEAKAETPVAKENSQESSVPGVRPATRPAPQAQTPAPPPRQMPKRQGDITFDDLKFDIEKGAPFERKMLTPEIEALHGKTVKLRGYILPASVFQQTGIQQFVLVRDNQECCFGPGAAIYDCVMVQMKAPATADFSTRPIAVQGRFEVKELKYPDGSGHLAIYAIEATEAR